MSLFSKKQFLFFFVGSIGLGLFFQNCGQPGSIAVSAGPTDPAPQTNQSVADTITIDPVTLIAGAKISINQNQPYTKSKNVVLQLSAVGAEQMIVANTNDCVEDIGWIPYSQVKAWVLSADNKEVSVYAKFRKKGAPETECVKASIVHDELAPLVQVEAVTPYTSATAVKINFLANDQQGSGVDKIYCKSNLNTQEIPCDAAYLFNSLPDEGLYTLQIRATDKAGNASTPNVSTFHVDRTAPTIKINGPQGLIASQNINYLIAVTDASPLKSVLCRLSPLESNYKDCSLLQAAYSKLPSGQFKFEVQAVDQANNVSVASQSIEIDLSVPTVKITNGPLALGNIKDVAFEFAGMSGSKVIDQFTCYLNNQTPVDCDSGVSYKGLIDNEYQFNVYGTNAVKVNSAVQSYKFIVDTLAPQIKFVSNPTGTIKVNSVEIVLDATDLNGLKSIECYLNGQVSDCSPKKATYASLSDGAYSFYAKATDKAGNSAQTAVINWKVDTTPDSKILASFLQNPVPENAKAQLDITLVSVTGASYNCVKMSDQTKVLSGLVSKNIESFQFVLTENTSCTVVGKDKNNLDIKTTVVAQVNCGNRINKNGICVDFKCSSVQKISLTDPIKIPVRTGSEGVCYAYKLFDAIANGASSLTQVRDTTVVARNHDSGVAYQSPYSMNKALINFTLSGPRVAKLSGGVDINSPIKVDNFVLVGLYPKALSTTSVTNANFYSAHGTSDATVTSSVNYVLLNNNQIKLTPFASGGTATVTPLEIVHEADTNLDYILDIRSLDCGGKREQSEIYLVFQ